MKAKDLAALAALGVAGFAAYDKFGKKSPVNSGAKAGAKLGDGERDSEAGESNARMNMRDMNEGSGRRDAGGNTEDVDRRRGAPERMKDIPESRQERDIPQAVEKFTPRDKEGLIKKKDTFVRPSAAGANSKTPAFARSNAAAPAAAVVEAAPKTRAFTPPGAQDSMGAFTTAGQAAEASPTTRAFTPPGYVASANAYNQARTTDTPSNAALGDYARAINPAMHADRMLAASHPSARITDKLAVDSRTNQAAYLAKKRAAEQQAKMNDIARLDALNKSNFTGGRRAKGGVVKMASGGMASSKMSSKPSTASSRGDGIAQRGKTRGKMC